MNSAVMIAILFMVTTALAGFGLGAVAALANNPWGTFAVAISVPAALFVAAYLRWVRPGKVLEASLLGVFILVLAPSAWLDLPTGATVVPTFRTAVIPAAAVREICTKVRAAAKVDQRSRRAPYS